MTDSESRTVTRGTLAAALQAHFDAPGQDKDHCIGLCEPYIFAALPAGGEALGNDKGETYAALRRVESVLDEAVISGALTPQERRLVRCSTVPAGAGGDREALRDAALNVLDFWEEVGCHCPNCEDRIHPLRVALGPFLPTADDVRGILADHP